MFKKAFEFDSDHPSLSQGRLSFIARRLEDAKKVKEIIGLATIALEFYPESAELHMEAGDIYLKTGDKEKAREYYIKALKLDSKLEEAKRKLEQLEKEKEK